jgi:hypothetical protein
MLEFAAIFSAQAAGFCRHNIVAGFTNAFQVVDIY